MAEGTGGTEITDPQRKLQREGTRHQFSIDRLDGAIAQRSVMLLEDAFQNPFLAIRSIDRCTVATLGTSDLHHDPGTIGQSLDQAVVDLVNLVPQNTKIKIVGVLWRVAGHSETSGLGRASGPLVPE
jgi:hypothetical protein